MASNAKVNDLEKKMKNFFAKVEDVFKPKPNPASLVRGKILEHIFSYCSGKDLIQCSMVNKTWYRTIAKSEKCMNKIELVIYFFREFRNDISFRDDDASAILNGTRNYVHLRLVDLYYPLIIPFKVILTAHKWQSVSLWNFTFRDKHDYLDFLGIIEPHVKSLCMRNVVVDWRFPQHPADVHYEFPKLTNLSIIDCFSFVYSEVVFRAIKNLTALCITTNPMHMSYKNHRDTNELLVERVRGTMYLLMNNPGLRHIELIINQKDFDNMFMNQRFTRKSFMELKNLIVGKFRSHEHNIIEMNNFVQFLKAQSGTLESFEMQNWLNNDVLEVALNFLKINRLRIGNLDPDKCGSRMEMAELNLYANSTIKELSLWTSGEKYHNVTKKILEKCKYVRVLEVKTLDQALLQTLIDYNDELRILVADNFTAYYPPPCEVLSNVHTMVFNSGCAENFRDLIKSYNRNLNYENVFLGAEREFRGRVNFESMRYNHPRHD
jgi:hypothetical protein